MGINLGFHDFYMATPFEVNIHPSLGVDVSDLAENMTYKPIKVFEPEKDLPLKWFECHPVIGNKLLCWHFEPDEDRTINLVITGNTWLYHDDLEGHVVVVNAAMVVVLLMSNYNG